MMSEFICGKCGTIEDYDFGSVKASTVYTLTDADGKETTLHLCDDCAVQQGFCISCGGFFGGTEEWFRSGISGCCVDCRTEIEFADEPDNDDYFEY